MTARLDRVLIYTSKVEETAAFYAAHFDYVVRSVPGDRITELVPPDGGMTILLHPAAKGQRAGQAQAKLVFSVDDVEAFHAAAADRGLQFGAVHRSEGYSFANAKDPAGNSIQITGRPRA